MISTHVCMMIELSRNKIKNYYWFKRNQKQKIVLFFFISINTRSSTKKKQFTIRHFKVLLVTSIFPALPPVPLTEFMNIKLKWIPKTNVFLLKTKQKSLNAKNLFTKHYASLHSTSRSQKLSQVNTLFIYLLMFSFLENLRTV